MALFLFIWTVWSLNLCCLACHLQQAAEQGNTGVIDFGLIGSNVNLHCLLVEPISICSG